MEAGPTQAMVSALIKTIKNPATPVASSVVTPANKLKRRARDDLTPKPTPTPRRPKRVLPETPLSGISELPDLSPDLEQQLATSSKEFDRVK